MLASHSARSVDGVSPVCALLAASSSCMTLGPVHMCCTSFHQEAIIAERKPLPISISSGMTGTAVPSIPRCDVMGPESSEEVDVASSSGTISDSPCSGILWPFSWVELHVGSQPELGIWFRELQICAEDCRRLLGGE